MDGAVLAVCNGQTTKDPSWPGREIACAREARPAARVVEGWRSPAAAHSAGGTVTGASLVAPLQVRRHRRRRWRRTRRPAGCGCVTRPRERLGTERIATGNCADCSEAKSPPTGPGAHPRAQHRQPCRRARQRLGLWEAKSPRHGAAAAGRRWGSRGKEQDPRTQLGRGPPLRKQPSPLPPRSAVTPGCTAGSRSRRRGKVSSMSLARRGHVASDSSGSRDPRARWTNPQSHPCSAG